MSIPSGLAAFLQQTRTTAGFALKRLFTERFLSLAAIVGLMVASGFILSVPLYAESTYFRLFREELLIGREGDLITQPASYAPMTFTFELKSVGRQGPQWKDAIVLDKYLRGDAQRVIGYPILQSVRRFRTDGYFLHPPLDPEKPETQYRIAEAQLAFISPLKGTIELVTGRLPVSSEKEDAPIEVIANEAMAAEVGVQAGDLYLLKKDDLEMTVRVVGLWRAINPRAAYWGSPINNWFLVDEDTYSGPLSSQIRDELASANWTFIASASRLLAGDIDRLETRIRLVEARAESLRPGTALVNSPLDALERYQQNAPGLTYLLYAFSVPILGLILTFIGLVTGLFIGGQRGEMAILRSRGATSLQVVWISLLQGAILGGVALLGGVFLANFITHSIGRARSFLDFSAAGGLRVTLTPAVLGYGLLGITLILFILLLLPALSAAANTIVSYKQERARMQHQPWWQKYFLDLFLLLPAAYGLWMLQRQSTSGMENAPDPLQNPLLLLVPALGIFSVALFTLRLVPRLMETLSLLLRPTKSVGMLMAARTLARTPAFYSAPLILLVLTLGLSAFTASLAETLDSQLTKQVYYNLGADVNILEIGTTFAEEGAAANYTFASLEDHLRIPDVDAATQVGRYKVSAAVSGGAVEGTFLGVQRETFPAVAYWQRDFADRQLGALLNELAATPNGVLVPADFLAEKNLDAGDVLTLGIKTGVEGQSVSWRVKIVGTFDLFPTWYPEDGVLMVGNLDEFFLQAGAEYPHEVWMSARRGADAEDIVYAVRGYSILLDRDANQNRLVEDGLNTFVKSWASADRNIRAEQSRPERQGLFGLLSVGFVASALLTVLGFLLYALFSFRRRFIEMGMLRAVGLSVRQMVSLLAAELAFLVLIGIGAGTVVGVFASQLFVPFLKIGAASQTLYPPFQVEIAWISILQIYLLFGVLFVAALAVLSRLLVRMKIFQAIKLGETS
ncbi:MAG: ABC transporter permease [Anaerolineae bacterium]|nr:ABC transporter permease [Anaerolineae bacterium]